MRPAERSILVNVLVYHYRVWPPRNDGPACGCGWGELGKSWPEHVVTVFEESVTASLTEDADERERGGDPGYTI